MTPIVVSVVSGVIAGTVVFVLWKVFSTAVRKAKNQERSLKLVPMLIHLPPSTEDIEIGGRDERDVANEEVSKAQVMYGIISSTLKKGVLNRLYGQRTLSFEMVAHDGMINYYTTVPATLTETIRQAITAAYPTARVEEVDDPNFFSKTSGIEAVAGGEFRMKEEAVYPIATFEDSRIDASLGLINAMSNAKEGDGLALQIVFRPTDNSWASKTAKKVAEIKNGRGKSNVSNGLTNAGQFAGSFLKAFWQSPTEEQKDDPNVLTNLQQDEITKLEEKTKFPGFEAKIRVVASTNSQARSEALIGGLVPVFAQFDLQNFNGFTYNPAMKMTDLVRDYIMRNFAQTDKNVILNSVEMASVFHLPSQNAIPTSQVQRQKTKEVDGPAKLMDNGIILGANEFRGEQKIIRLGEVDRRRHTYFIGATGSGKSNLLGNLAYQDMCDGRGFCFIDPHGDAIDKILSKVPAERMDDVILFEPGNTENPVGMNMFEFQTEDQIDFIVQESLNVMVSLYDPGNQGIFGPRAQHMFRNAALLLMSDPNGGTFIDVPRCFIDPAFVKEKLKYVKDKTVYDYWSKEFPASQKSSEAGETISWFVSKWGPFLSNHMLRNILGQVKSGFNIREIMDNKKIFLVNLSKGTVGELNAKLMGMIFVMKFQAAAMSRADTPEDERQDFCLYVDEFQNFCTESFESILSEARKYRLNLILANQFMTQLTDKIREAILGNVGTIMCGRIGVTDAELMEKAFSPVFTAEDLHKQENFHVIATVMMYNMPTSPFTIHLLPEMGESNEELMKRMRTYVSSKYGRPKAEVEAEINARLGGGEIKPGADGGADGSASGSGAASGGAASSASGSASSVGVSGAASGASSGAASGTSTVPSEPTTPNASGSNSATDSSSVTDSSSASEDGQNKNIDNSLIERWKKRMNERRQAEKAASEGATEDAPEDVAPQKEPLDEAIPEEATSRDIVSEEVVSDEVISEETAPVENVSNSELTIDDVVADELANNSDDAGVAIERKPAPAATVATDNEGLEIERKSAPVATAVMEREEFMETQEVAKASLATDMSSKSDAIPAADEDKVAVQVPAGVEHGGGRLTQSDDGEVFSWR